MDFAAAAASGESGRHVVEGTAIRRLVVWYIDVTVVSHWYPVARWYAADGVELVDDVSDVEMPCAAARRVQRGAARRVAELLRAAALVVAARRQRA